MKMKSFVTVVVLTLVLVTLQKMDWVHAQSSAPPRLDSEVTMDTGNGFGSSGVYARRFTNTDQSVGSDITYTADATNGDSFTVNANGIYAISFTDYSSLGDTALITLNANPATNVNSLTVADRLCTFSLDVGRIGGCSVTIELATNDVIRAERANAGQTDASAFVRLEMVRVR